MAVLFPPPSPVPMTSARAVHHKPHARPACQIERLGRGLEQTARWFRQQDLVILDEASGGNGWGYRNFLLRTGG